MTIKSLLLGSAAALVAVSGARAADAIIAEPEPVEYVRVCDMYGAGWFYIPGTETCLRIGGYVWYQVATSSQRFGDTQGEFGNVEEGWYKSIRARLNVDARNETEWGTLRSRIRLQATWDGTNPSTNVGGIDGPTSVDQAWFRLGNTFQFTAGYSESFWANSQNGGASNWGSHSWHGMYYGYEQTALMAFSYVGDTIEVAVSLEDDNRAGDGYVPDVVGKIAYYDSWGAIWVRGGYDNEVTGVYDPVSGEDGFGAQLGMQFNIPNSPGSSLRLIGYYADSDNRFADGPAGYRVWDGINRYGTLVRVGGAEWSVLGSYQQVFSSTLSASVAFQYFGDLYAAGTDISSGYDAYAAELSVVWTPITNFEVRSELHYVDITGEPAGTEIDGTFSGFLRFTRYF